MSNVRPQDLPTNTIHRSPMDAQSNQIQTADRNSGSQVPPFFPVSTTKFLLLSVCTLGLYELYWFYKNWQLIQAREGVSVSPFWRAFFAFFFCYQVFTRIRDYPTQTQRNKKLAAGALAAGWIVTTVLWKLPDPYWLTSMFAVLFMVPVQRAAATVNTEVAPESDQNHRLSAVNWITIVVGGILVLLAVIGTFMGEK